MFPLITLMPQGNVAIDCTKVDRSLLDGMVNAEDSGRGHRYPIVPTPALYHQKEVEMSAMRHVVLLKIVVRLLHKATYLAAQKHFG